MNPKMIFFNVGWMDFYQGLDKGDSLKNGGLHNESYKWGGEIMNFKPFQNKMYGYVQPVVSENQVYHESKIKIERINPEAEGSLSEVLVVWTATNPEHGGTYVIGWYKNATIFSTWQKDPKGSNRIYKRNSLGHFTTAKEKDCVLLPQYARTLRVPRKGSGSMGRSNVWFAEDAEEFKQNVFDLVNGKQVTPVELEKDQKKTGRKRIQPDPEKRLKIELAAVKLVTEYFINLGYIIDSKEKDNLGWDLDAVRGKIHLRVEVKGLSGSTVQADLTPNEYEKMYHYKESYVICIVTNAMETPTLKVFYYSSDIKNWRTDSDERLHVKEIVAARVSI
jgi:hypothetical protein